MHIHLGPIPGLTIFLTVLIFGAIWRVIASCLSDTTVGRAMAFVY